MSASRLQREQEYTYEYDGTLALERMQKRYAQRQETFDADERQMAQRRAKKKRSTAVARGLVVSLLAFGVVFGLLYMQTQIQQNNLIIASKKSELKQLEKENADLQLDVVLADDIDKVRTVAQEKFGMDTAGAGQVMRVKLNPAGASGLSAQINGQ